MMSVTDFPSLNDFWFTSFITFNTEDWGYIGFNEEWQRENFLDSSPSGAVTAIYITKNKGPTDKRGKIVGFIQTGKNKRPSKECMPDYLWREKQSSGETRLKQSYAVEAIRA